MLMMCSSCGPVPYAIKKPIEHVSPLDSEKIKVYVKTFEDERAYSEIGRSLGLRTVKYYPVENMPKGMIVKVDKQKLKKANIGKLGSDTLVDVLRRNKINALSSSDAKPVMDKHDLLIKGKVIDYLFRFSCFFPIARSAFETGLEITIENFGGKELMKKKYIRVYKARFPHRGKVSTMSGDELYAECLDIELRIICQEIINDEEFKKAIVVLEKK